jgi:hypothetical protein
VKAEATDPVSLGQLVGDPIDVCVLGERGVKGGIEGRHQRNVSPERGAAGADPGEAWAVVQGCQLLQRLDGAGHRAVDHGRLHEALAPVDHAMTDRLELHRGLPDPLQDPANRLLVIGDRRGLAPRRPSRLLEREIGGAPDALHQAATERPHRTAPAHLDLKEPELHRRAAAVEGEDLHERERTPF